MKLINILFELLQMFLIWMAMIVLYLLNKLVWYIALFHRNVGTYFFQLVDEHGEPWKNDIFIDIAYMFKHFHDDLKWAQEHLIFNPVDHLGKKADKLMISSIFGGD